MQKKRRDVENYSKSNTGNSMKLKIFFFILIRFNNIATFFLVDLEHEYLTALLIFADF